MDEVAGIYVGKRTETYETEVRRFNEVVVIEADGTVMNYIEFNGEYVLASTGRIELGEDGAFGNEEAAGLLRLNGRHLSVDVQFSPPSFPDVVVAFQGRRSNSNPLTAFMPSSQDHASSTTGWLPVK